MEFLHKAYRPCVISPLRLCLWLKGYTKAIEFKLCPHVVFQRGVGCIMFEMATGRPMFPGATVKEELHLVFRLMGEPARSPQSAAGPCAEHALGHSGSACRAIHWVRSGWQWTRPVPWVLGSLQDLATAMQFWMAVDLERICRHPATQGEGPLLANNIINVCCCNKLLAEPRTLLELTAPCQCRVQTLFCNTALAQVSDLKNDKVWSKSLQLPGP